MAVFWGVFMWLMMEILPIFISSREVNVKTLIVTFFLWMLGGFIFAYINSKTNPDYAELAEQRKKRMEELEKNTENIDYLKGSNPDEFLKDEKWIKSENQTLKN